jgi:hypothetical protein
MATPTAKLDVVTTPCPDSRSDKEIDPYGITDNGAAEYGVGQPMTDVAHLSKHYVDADKTAERAHQHGCQKAVPEEFILKGE